MSVEARGLMLVGFLTALAGMVDVIGYLHLNFAAWAAARPRHEGPPASDDSGAAP